MNRPYLYLLSFLEGSAVMACELIGAKILAPYFGTSLYVWAAALGLTLGGLMCGYFAGGLVSKRYPNQLNLLYWLLVVAGVFTALMPISGPWIMQYAIGWNLPTGAMLSLLVFMVPPLILMGMISPIVINLLNDRAKEAGNNAGNVYAISTLGGICMTFLLGFYIIPQLGVSYPAIAIGLLLGALPILSLVKQKQWVALLALLIFAWAGRQVHHQIGLSKKETLLYHSEGILGQIKVIDLPIQMAGKARTGRSLIVNNSIQSVKILEDPQQDFYPYTYYIPELARRLPKGSQVLVLGMGGGTLAERLLRIGMKVDVVDIDQRMHQVATGYFGLSDQVEIIIDDARHYLRICQKKYDLIVYDTFISESAPEYMLTLEGLADAGSCLSQQGSLLINFYGYLEGSQGRVVRSVYKTLLAAELPSHLFVTPGTEQERNIIFVAGRPGHLLSDPILPDDHLPEATRPAYILNTDDLNIADGILLTDDRPQPQLYAKASAAWRKRYNQEFTLQFSEFRTY
jgi:predicted membrane-bound spermidine synthase